MDNVTGCILSGITEGLFIVVLQDTSGGRSHTVGVNRGLKIIYDCMETHELKLNMQNLNKCCGITYKFNFIGLAAELKDNNVHAKKN